MEKVKISVEELTKILSDRKKLRPMWSDLVFTLVRTSMDDRGNNFRIDFPETPEQCGPMARDEFVVEVSKVQSEFSLKE